MKRILFYLLLLFLLGGSYAQIFAQETGGTSQSGIISDEDSGLEEEDTMGNFAVAAGLVVLGLVASYAAVCMIVGHFLLKQARDFDKAQRALKENPPA